MKDWVKNKNIAYGEGDTIPQLLLKVKVLDLLKVFKIEQASEEHCKKNKLIVILQLPVGGKGSVEERNVQSEGC